MPYADPTKRLAAKRESARRRRAADPPAARDYDRDQKARRRAGQRAGPNATPREIELLQRYPERAINSVQMRLGRKDDLRVAIECSGYQEPWFDPDREWRPGEDTWVPRNGYHRFAAPFAYDEEERDWITYYRMFITPPMLKGLRLSAGDIRWMLREEIEGPDDPDWRWLRMYGADGRDRAIELTATLAGEAMDVRRLARYLRHHPGSWWWVSPRLESRLPTGRLERAIDRLRRLGYLYGEGALIR